MQITKHGHACLTIAEGGRSLMIDPGVFTDSIGLLDAIDGVVITHEHVDHWSVEHLTAVIGANPGIPIYTTAGVAKELSQFPTVEAIDHDVVVDCDGFSLRFTSGLHALIHRDLPQPQNLGVMVNDAFYYGGDSYLPPDRAVQTLAVPISAPWLKVAELFDYMEQVKPNTCVNTHDALLSERGVALLKNMVGAASDRIGSTYTHLTPGDTLPT